MRSEIDVLNRSKTLQDLQDILLMLSENRRGCVFAIDGGWGYGKTHILKKLEAQLEISVNEKTLDDRYYVFHYNCWQYDYYDEPAIAIVSAMLEKFENELDEKIVGIARDSWKHAKELLRGIAGDFVKNKIGIDLVDVYEHIKQNGEERLEETFVFDELFSFKKTLDITRKKIAELAENKTVVLVVDELDRCMPSYAIKVLERLHHLFEGIENVIVLLAIDSTQLEHSVKEIYGQSIDTERYLKKFIGFSVKLSIGDLQECISEKYEYYFKHFIDDEKVIPFIIDLSKLCGMDIRNFDKLIEKLNLVHEVVCKKEMSASVLLFEIVCGLMKYRTLQAYYKEVKNAIAYSNNLHWLLDVDKNKYMDLEECIGKRVETYLKESKQSVMTGSVISGMPANQNVVKTDLYGIMWYLLDVVLANNKTFYVRNPISYQEMVDVCKKFNELINAIW